MGTPSCDKHTVHWFRKGLRLHDNPALREGLRSATTFRCVFIIDPWFAGSSNVGINKWRFLLQCLEDLDRSLRALNSRLFVIRGQPADALPKLFREWGTTSLTFEEDPEPFGRVRDHNIKAMCREIGISVVSQGSHTLYKLDKIIEKNGGKAPLTYHQFQTVIAGMGAPSGAEPAVTSSNLGGATTPVNDDHDEKYGVPTLEELGFDTDSLRPPTWIGGEREALSRLDKHLERKEWVASFGRPKMTPQSLLPSKTGLSPYLRFGCLSTRLFYYQLTDLYKKIKKTRPPLSLHGQLLWREFFYCAATNNPNFDRMAGNPICVQIPWDKNADALSKWANGQTGFPWIDAIMIQLREEGWIHHLARHAVACFLTRGDLWLSWEEGMKIFEELLLDADWSVNAGMWMWLSCSSFFQHFFHCYCPIRFGRKADPNGEYIRKYIPSLKDFPTRYIHSPWLAPDEVQSAAGCVIGRDYPWAMVDHDVASKCNIQRIKQVYRHLAKSKNISEETCKNGNLLVQQLSRPNTVISSPSPTSIITTVNHSTYLCSTSPEDNRNNQQQSNGYSSRNYNNSNGTVNEQLPERYSNNRTISYGNCNKTLSDIFEDNQQRNSHQARNIPFKKIVIVEQDYEKHKNRDLDSDVGQTIESYVTKTNAENQRFDGQMKQNLNHFNGDYIEKSCYNSLGMSQNSYGDEINNSYAFQKSHYSNASQNDKTVLSGYYYKTGADTNRYVMANENGNGAVNLNGGIYEVTKKRYDMSEKVRSKQPFSYEYYKYNTSIRRKSESDSSDSFQDQNYDSKVINDRMFDNACHKMRKNYSFRTSNSSYGGGKTMNYIQMQSQNYDNVLSPNFNYSEPMKQSPDESVTESSSGSQDYGRSDDAMNLKNRHECSLTEESVRFQQGQMVIMQDCNRPDRDQVE